jgi:3-isopropylmalate/(R)-2-methylmalate dehydratase small subunit
MYENSSNPEDGIDMEKFVRLTAVAAPIDMDDVNTDQIIPARLMRKPRVGKVYGQYLLHDLRFNEDESEKSGFVLNQPAYRQARIFVASHNYGCGSSRLGAVFTHLDFGVRAVIAVSFGDVFFNNCLKNGILTIRLPAETTAALRTQLHDRPGANLTVDLEAQTVTDALGKIHEFAVDHFAKRCLFEGLSDIALTLKRAELIDAFEKRHREQFSWLPVS